MALNLSPKTGVKLTKKDKVHILKKMKTGLENIMYHS